MVGLLRSSADIVLAVTVCLHQCLAIWVGKIVILSTHTLSCLCWVGILFLAFCCPLWLLGECGVLVLPGRKVFLDPNRCGLQGFKTKCVSRYFELSVHRREGSALFCQVLHSPLGLGADSKESPKQKELGRRLWIEFGEGEREAKGHSQHTPCPGSHSLWAPRECLMKMETEIRQ